MNKWEAKRKLVGLLMSAECEKYNGFFSGGLFSDDCTRASVQSVTVNKDGFDIVVRVDPDQHEYRESVLFSNIDTVNLQEGTRCVRPQNGNLFITFRTPGDARAFMDAFYNLKREAEGQNDAVRATKFEEFQEQARAWRSLAVRPPLPDEVNRQRILAEDALREKKFDEALEHYEKGLTACPLWPQGQFNAAIICGEVEDYFSPVNHARRYLELAPDASNAKTIREKLIVWDDKARR